MKSSDMLPNAPGARPGVLGPSSAPPASDSPRTLAVVREDPPATRFPERRRPPVRAFVDRYEATHSLSADVLASHLHLPRTVFARYADRHLPPRWLVLAVAGIGIARGIPAEDLNWLLDAAPA